MKVTVTPSSNPVPVSEREKRVLEPGFGKYFTDHMVRAEWNQASGWSDASVEAYGPFSLDPAAMVFHYGQEIFEGMKAYSQPDGSIALFRPDANGVRFAKSAARIALPELPVEDFVKAVEALVRIDAAWVPKKVGESLYIRPFMIATEVGLGVRPANKALFSVIATPAAAYFNAAKAVTVWISTEYVRAAMGGTGEAKCGGNYAASLLAQQQAATQGCDQVVWLDAQERRWVEEMGGMNLYFVKGKGKDATIFTPKLTGTLLAGITRDSILSVASDLGYKVEEGMISIEDWRDGVASGEISEIFACGTAAVIAPVGTAKSVHGTWVTGDGNPGVITMEIRNHLLGIQHGTIADKHGWMKKSSLMAISDAFHIYDTTLRDGAQQEGLNLSVHDKLTIARHLDDLGVGFIEGGWPGANPKDTEFFKLAQTELKLKNATFVAFGATRRPNVKAADDALLRALQDSGAPAVTLVAKSHDRHVDLALKTHLDENLAMIRDSIEFLRAGGQRVFLDAEHFFDGYRSNTSYALEVVRVAAEAGADVIALCDTNGGMLPDELADVVHEVLTRSSARLGIHCHNDTGCAIANSLAAVAAGATHVQGTLNGYGERTGNADLVSIIANLQLKKKQQVLPEGALEEAFRISHAVAEVTNVAPSARQPYVGVSAFAHKAGLHASAIKVDPALYQHEDPESVGNDMRMLVSEMAGRASIELKSQELGIDLSKEKEVVTRVVERVKNMEARGYTFEAADASFELLLREELDGKRPRFFHLDSWETTVDQNADKSVTSRAAVRIRAKGETIESQGAGNGPVNAIDNALRNGLEKLYPELKELELTDYKVRILEGRLGTGAITRVLVETSDGNGEWSTIGVHENVIAASAMALEDALTYGLLRQGKTPD